MMMENGRFCHVAYTMSRCDQPLAQVHIFKSGQFFIETVLFPGRAQYCRIGIVAEEPILRNSRLLGKVFGEDPALAVIAVIVANLSAYVLGHFALDKGLAHGQQPVFIDRHAMAGNEDQNITPGKFTAAIE